MPIRSAAALALLLCLGSSAVSCSHAPWNPHRGWSVWRTGNVELYTDAVLDPKLTLDYLDASYEVLSRTLFREDEVPPAKVVHVSTPSVSPLTNADGSYRTFATVVAEPGTVLLVGDTGRLSHYAHAMAHHFIHHAVPRAPLWLHEGLALYASRFRKEPSDPRILCFGTTQPADARYVIEPLDKLFSLTWKDYNEVMAPTMDGTAWGFVDYLMHGEDGRLRGRFQQLVRQLASGQSTDQALRAVYPELPRETLDKRLQDHVRTRRPADLCPVSLPLGPGYGRRQAITTAEVPEGDIKQLFSSLEAIPVRRGFADYIPR